MIRSSFFDNSIHNIWLDDMPNIRRIYEIINDIYVVRELNEYRLEEDLFAKLLFIMRSRELAIKLTRFDNNELQ